MNLAPCETPVPVAAPANVFPWSRTRRPGFRPLVAALGVAAAGVVATVGYQHWRGSETAVVIHFQDVHGLRPGADLRHRGVPVGRVTDVRLRPDLAGVDVRVVLSAPAGGMARKGSRFWITRPTFTMANGLSGLDTAVGDKYVAVLPAVDGDAAGEFVGEEDPPLPDAPPDSLSFVLRAKRRSSAIRPGAPITCCGIRIGQIQTMELADDGKGIRVRVWVEARFAKLVCSNARFAALEVFDGGMLGKLRLDFPLGGGIEVEVPSSPGPRVAPDQVLELH
jgi:paraquat-inducible protein B